MNALRLRTLFLLAGISTAAILGSSELVACGSSDPRSDFDAAPDPKPTGTTPIDATPPAFFDAEVPGEVKLKELTIVPQDATVGVDVGQTNPTLPFKAQGVTVDGKVVDKVTGVWSFSRFDVASFVDDVLTHTGFVGGTGEVVVKAFGLTAKTKARTTTPCSSLPGRRSEEGEMKLRTVPFGLLLLYMLSGGGHRAQAADLEHGRDVFATECAECHSVREGKNKKGPTLFAIVGRKAGAVADATYSDPLKASGIIWTPDRIDAYVSNPRKAVPGGKMKYDGLASSTERADLLAYLGTLK